MTKYNNYKKYYETHTEQEKKRFHDYYYANRERILAKQREKRKNMPKVKKPTLTERFAVVEKALELACEKIDAEYMDGIYCTEYPEYFKNKAKEMLKDE